MPSWIFERSNSQLPVGKMCINVPICVTVQNFTVIGRKGREGQKCVTTPNFTAIGWTVAEIWRFLDFSWWQPPSWIFKCGKYRCGKGSRRPKCVTVPNFAEISQTVAVIWPFFDFSTFRFFKVAEAAILDFKNVEILRVRKLKTAKVRHRAKFRGIGQTIAEKWPFLFSRWRPPPSWILKMWKF